MADSKITALTSISTSSDPANDPLVIVDVSDTSMAATGTTKKVTLNQLLATSPTATLASATITGDLTVDTSTLKVDSANNRVIVGHTSGSSAFQVTNAGAAGLEIQPTGFSSAPLILSYNRSSSAYTQLTLDGSTIVHALNGSTAMTLNSNGLLIGTTVAPAYSSKLRVEGGVEIHTSQALNIQPGNTNPYEIVNRSAGGFAFYPTGSALGMTLDASGNLLVGTTGTVVSSDSRFRVSATAVPAVDAKTTAATQAVVDEWNSDTSGDNLFNRFWTESSPIAFRGSISYNRAGGLVAYNTTSDYRAKDIIGPVSNSGSLIDSLKVYVGKMKGATIERPMLIAHELQEVAPYAVSGEKDAVDADGKPKYQQMDASALVPLLIAEIKSLRARVQTLETR
jgi:hypothetical protein